MTFYTQLKQMSTTCVFDNADGEIKTQIIEKCSNNALRLKARDHANKDWTLTKLIETGRAMELSKIQAAAMEQVLLHDKVNQLSVSNSKPTVCTTSKNSQQSHYRGRGKKQNSYKKFSAPTTKHLSVCRNCGHEWPHTHGRTSCPAYGKECGKCHRQNHFALYCMSSAKKSATGQHSHRYHTNALALPQNDSSDNRNDSNDSYLYVRKDTNNSDCPMFNVTVNDHQMIMMADSGACRSLMDEADYNKLLPLKPTPEKTGAKIYPYRSTVPLPIIGSFDTGKRQKHSMLWKDPVAHY